MSERIEIPAEKLHEEMLKLRQGKHMDFLRSLTGMDWGEEGLGVVYHLEDTNTRENIVVSTRTTNREKPELPSVSDIWKGAEFNEREVYDYVSAAFRGQRYPYSLSFCCTFLYLPADYLCFSCDFGNGSQRSLSSAF